MLKELFEVSNEDAKRVLASVQKIGSLAPIPNKDRIVLASVLGYKTIVKSSEFKPGDLCIYFEVDSWVDTSMPAFSFLQKRAKLAPDGKLRARIETIKMGEAYSQGLAIQPSHFPELANEELKIGRDLTQFLNVLKYERGGKAKPKPKKLTWKRKLLKLIMKVLPYSAKVWLGSKFKAPPSEFSSWPGFCPPKTDEERLQTHPSYLDRMRGLDCYSTMKMDGSSFTAVKRNGKLVVCSRNRVKSSDAANAGNLVSKLGKPNQFLLAAKKYGLAEKMQDGEAVQAELLAPNIQKGRVGVESETLYVFNVFKDGKQLDIDAALTYCDTLGVPHAPVLERFKLTEDLTVDKFVEKVVKLTYPSGFPSEGIVVRALDMEAAKVAIGKRCSFKIISPAWEVAVGKVDDEDEQTTSEEDDEQVE